MMDQGQNIYRKSSVASWPWLSYLPTSSLFFVIFKKDCPSLRRKLCLAAVAVDVGAYVVAVIVVASLFIPKVFVQENIFCSGLLLF